MEAAECPVPDWLYGEAGMSVPHGARPQVAQTGGDNFGAQDTRVSLYMK